jgi:hypothetical protein
MNENSQTNPLVLIVFWLYVALPLAWGIFNTLKAASKLFS